jgi:hypothetical protein
MNLRSACSVIVQAAGCSFTERPAGTREGRSELAQAWFSSVHMPEILVAGEEPTDLHQPGTVPITVWPDPSARLKRSHAR